MSILGDSDAVQLSNGQSDGVLSKQGSIAKSETNVAYESQHGSGSDDDDLSLDKNPFLDPQVAERWVATYEEAHYECRHVFDPTITWSEEEEKKIIRKLDFRVCLWAVRKLIPWPARLEMGLTGR